MNDYSNLNNLTPDAKLVIVNAQALVNETNEMIVSRKYLLDLTSKLQLKSDCKEIERTIKMIQKGKNIEKHVKSLELSTIRLRTNLNGIISFYERG